MNTAKASELLRYVRLHFLSSLLLTCQHLAVAKLILLWINRIQADHRIKALTIMAEMIHGDKAQIKFVYSVE